MLNAGAVTRQLKMFSKLPGKSFAREVPRRHGNPASLNEAIFLYNRSLDHLGEGGHPRDYSGAFELNAKAAALDYPDAVLAMGWFYVGGRGVGRDISLALHWYRRSARTGEPRAMFSLGQIAFDESAYAESQRWFRRAAERGHLRSHYWLGKLAWRGHGVSRDRSAAFALFHRAARGHDPEAIRVLRYLSRHTRKT